MPAIRNDERSAVSFNCTDDERYNDALVAAYSGNGFGNENARTSARQLEFMKQRILQSKDPLSSRVSWVPIPFNILDAVMLLQTFVVNARGCTDNLARVWLREKALRGEDAKIPMEIKCALSAFR